MNIAYFGYNTFSSCLHVFDHSDHQIQAIFTGASGPHTDKVVAFARQNHIRLKQEKPSLAVVSAICEEAAIDLIFCAEYPWLIPIPQGIKAINLHPSLLPHGRGPTPLPWLLMRYPQHAGLTFHEMTPILDTGPILLQEKIDVIRSDNYESLNAKMIVKTPPLLTKLLANFDNYYDQKAAQGEGSYWPAINTTQQTIHWHEPIERICATLKRFGRHGVIAELEQEKVLLYHFDAFEQAHPFPPGTVIYKDTLQYIITAKNGFVSILTRNMEYLLVEPPEPSANQKQSLNTA